ncbi:hypothetical protein P8C59_001495 [Phyllachora maydis]|uniref:Cystathionine beta-lyase n=1 Tax=Phyllachora maydis TaxID=1825666 RepID=A0AAD9M969_9PEZI|nr:hypothetical protein P8C59_001495 [Phyllachora maydis]
MPGEKRSIVDQAMSFGLLVAFGLGSLVVWRNYVTPYLTSLLDPEKEKRDEARMKARENLQRLRPPPEKEGIGRETSEPGAGPQELVLNEYENMVALEVVAPQDISVGFEDIGGLEDIIEELKESIIYPLTMPHLYQHGGALLAAPSGVLLYGPPGCGKTMLAKALAHESRASFINLHISTLTEKWYGDSNKLVRAVFSLATKLQPAIIFIDEIDAVLGTRRSGEHEASGMVKAEFMTLWDGLTSANAAGQPARIVVLGATNRINDIDEAILRRMPKKFPVPLPGKEQRRRILQLILGNTKRDAEFDLDYIAKFIHAEPSAAPRNGPRRYALATELVYTDSKDQYGASSVPIYQSATFKQTSSQGGNEYDYTRSGNPTRTHLERHLAKIMNASRALAVSSGMGALDVITRLLRPGDEVVTGDDLYGGSHRLLTYLSANQGVVVHHVDTTNAERVKEVLTDKTTMVLLETPTNPLIKVVDVATIARAAHACNERALVVVDNTMLSPMLFNPLDTGADIAYESGTKYLSGHHDIMAGVIACNHAQLGDKLYATINATGCGLGPQDAFLLMRGVKTLAIRMEKQQTNAQRIAEFLESHGFRVRYPGLKSHPQYDLHWSMARGAGAVLSFETGDVALSERIVEAAHLWAISVSFGCVNSLISMPCRMSHASIDAKTRAERQMPEDIIRLCVGIEDVDDLIDDLSRALVQAGAVALNIDGFHANDANEANAPEAAA